MGYCYFLSDGNVFYLAIVFAFTVADLTSTHSTIPPPTSLTKPPSTIPPPPPQVRCIESGRFYRDPDVQQHESGKKNMTDIWSRSECAKYFLCLDGEVFAFQCTANLAFDVEKQLCTGIGAVQNCDLITDNDEDLDEQTQLVTETETVPLQTNSNHVGKITAHDQKSSVHVIGCERLQRPCLDGSICLPTAFFCDGSDDCPDGSDEAMCNTIDDPNAALPCNVTACKLPDCFCSRDGTNVPGNLDVRHVPQMVTITFDDAVTSENFRLYVDTIFTPGDGERTNPNGCPLTGTFFVSHVGNDYHRTQRLYNTGHEIAIHSITHRQPPLWWSHNATIEDWFDEMIGQANIVHRFARVPMRDISGVRAPHLQIGWHRQLLMMKEFGFAYDSTIVAPAAYSEIPLWPYTLDYRMPHDCIESRQNCPTRSFAGIWEMVINPLVGKDYTCSMVHKCPATLTGEEVYHLLHYNFKRHYHTNRAPFGLYFQSKWFKKIDYLNAFMHFLDDLLEYADVWFVSKAQVMDWLRSPTPLDRIDDLVAWTCDHQRQPVEVQACAVPNVCKLRADNAADLRTSEMTMNTCAECPAVYPWLRNEFGKD